MFRIGRLEDLFNLVSAPEIGASKRETDLELKIEEKEKMIDSLIEKK